MAFLKSLSDTAEGAMHDPMFDWHYDVPPSAGFTGGWAYNAINSGLLAGLCPKHRVNVYADRSHPERYFQVPPNFGRKLVDHD
jgi:hypothetical protein